MKIAYIEDEPETVANIQEFLQLHGHTVQVLDSISAFGSYCNTQGSPDLILLDIMMRHGGEFDAEITASRTGVELMRRIRAGEPIAGSLLPRDLPIIVITAVGDPMEHAAISTYEPIEVLEKPVSGETEVGPVLDNFLNGGKSCEA